MKLAAAPERIKTKQQERRKTKIFGFIHVFEKKSLHHWFATNLGHFSFTMGCLGAMMYAMETAVASGEPGFDPSFI